VGPPSQPQHTLISSFIGGTTWDCGGAFAQGSAPVVVVESIIQRVLKKWRRIHLLDVGRAAEPGLQPRQPQSWIRPWLPTFSTRERFALLVRTICPCTSTIEIATTDYKCIKCVVRCHIKQSPGLSVIALHT
jgi:hypothetical protein